MSDSAKKDALLESIGAEMRRRGLQTPQLQQVDPSITAKQVSGIRHGDRSAASIERLELIARGLGLLPATYNPCECAA